MPHPLFLAKTYLEAGNFDLRFVTLGEIFCLSCFAFGFEFETPQTTQNVSNEKTFYTRKMDTFEQPGQGYFSLFLTCLLSL